ncbi:protein mono-ADP-ribosyltransferase PARP9 [Danio aesculapii]|uniref:protein mono-ADP-ribosyltransferase PARP9 n=1 Tax=Danio aesculapii TaxID=1142201 RepID=UPI0024BF2D6B|nr:protein mono-ADP-ribosyltransferase PARP9 [Danio aesculapii]XP_056321241.1 protein mono-ADP-ribosyltransferase PARP9 [Danio aesculapii]XP_056321242.1 protein mono-ADP-ribosyltransferase PARP9 [Danio aesculapii]
MSDKEQGLLPLAAEQAAILAKCGNAFCHAINEKFNCTAILRNIEDAGSFNNTSRVFRAEKRYFADLSSGVEISVWKDDLTQHKVDAVVNAANEKLQHGGGLAQALSTAGGPIIQKLSNDYIQKFGKVPVGKAVRGPAGALPCKYIIHAVGPRVSPSPSKKEVDQAAPLLSDAISSILQIVVKENISSVAIPALSSGLYNFPRDRCADIIVKSIKQFNDFTGFQGKNVKIHLVNHDEPSVQEMERATVAILGQSSTSHSGAHQGSMTSSSRMRFGNVMLHLKKGAIEEEKVDVIVNTIAADCNLSKGLISMAILNKAGKKIQEDINKQKYSSTNVYVTSGYNLKCQAVYHTACAFRSQFNSKQILFGVVLECLKKAGSKYKSISFPAIGTGHLGFKKQEVAAIMTDAVAEFAKQNMKLDVNFVVFPEDNGMMEAFEQEIKKWKQEAQSPGGHEDTTRFALASRETSANKTPTVEFQSVSTEAMREAKEWALNMLKQPEERTIKNNHVVYLGQKEHEFLLTLQTMFDVRIEEFFKSGNGGITITGSPLGVSCAAIEVESMLCKAQDEFAQAEERDLLYSVVRWSCKDEPWIQTPEISAILEKAYLAGQERLEINNYKVNFLLRSVIDNKGSLSSVERKCLLGPFQSLKSSFFGRVPVTRHDSFEKDGKKAFNASRLHIVKVEKLENIVLKQLFDKNGQRIKCQPKRLYQCVSAQYCDLICRVGFQKEFAPPAEQKYGSGIYFSSSVDGALKLWSNPENELYIYIIQAQVLTGKSAYGSPDLILPPSVTGDPLERYDSLSDKVETHVIFSGQQALPEYLIICAKSSFV